MIIRICDHEIYNVTITFLVKFEIYSYWVKNIYQSHKKKCYDSKKKCYDSRMI